MEEVKTVVTTEDEEGEMLPYEDGATDAEFDELVKTMVESIKKAPSQSED